MSISSAIYNAGSGLGAAARLADTISNNVSNALTPGYARRVTDLTSLSLNGYGSGVRIGSVVRAENTYMTVERRAMDASLGNSATFSAAYARMIAAVGEPGSPSSLSTRATALETALLGAVASPQSLAKLSEAVNAAQQLVSSVNRIASETMQMRGETDAEIARQVETVNTSLHRIDEVNRKIQLMTVKGLDTSALEDERGRLIDAIAPIVPVRTIKRDDGQVALYTQNGGMLLDGKVFELHFTRGPAVITADMSLGSPLSGLAQDQNAIGGVVPISIGTGSASGLMDGGSLSALFELRDRVVPEFNGEIDRYAGDLIERFRDLMPPGALDGAGDGLFLDKAPPAPPADPVVGLASRLALNTAADPIQGGEAWRLRDGLAAAAPGPQGFGAFLEAMADAMSEARVPPAGFVSATAANGSAGFAAEVSSFFAGRSARSEDQRAFFAAQQAVLSERETDATGVDSDAELQYLMVVEQAYAANARVLSVLDSLLKQLLEI
jgi:flagellar hook-associated protein 1 FlgK